jgi:hypothetical protein
VDQYSPQAPSGTGGPGPELATSSPQPASKPSGGGQGGGGGGCSPPCRSGTVCCQGKCCAAGQSCCNGACVDTSSSTNNCGGCNSPCPSGTTCSGSKCTCTDTSSTLCNGTCVNTQTDTKNCGSCGNACGTTGDACINGQCTCGGGAPCAAGTACQSGLCSGEFCADSQIPYTGYCPAGQRCCGHGYGQHCYNPETHVCCETPYCGYYGQADCEVCDLSSERCCPGYGCVASGNPCP